MRVRFVRRTDLKSLTPQNKQLKILGGIVSNPRVSATNVQYLPKTNSETAWIAAGIFNCVVLKLMICSLDFWFFALRQRTLISIIINVLQWYLIHNSRYSIIINNQTRQHKIKLRSRTDLKSLTLQNKPLKYVERGTWAESKVDCRGYF